MNFFQFSLEVSLVLLHQSGFLLQKAIRSLFTQKDNSEPIYSKRQLGFLADFLDVSTQKLTFPANWIKTKVSRDEYFPDDTSKI